MPLFLKFCGATNTSAMKVFYKKITRAYVQARTLNIEFRGVIGGILNIAPAWPMGIY